MNLNTFLSSALLCLLTLGFAFKAQTQHTFSIVAVDESTGEVGSAGATCLDNIQFPGTGGAIIISDLIPGVGAINTQSYYEGTNQVNARGRLNAGWTPQQVIDWLAANDVANDSSIRQYGIAAIDIINSGTSAASLTGSNCFDYKGHIVGIDYAIQGNILLGPEILDSMHAKFLNTNGDLATKLMACLQGANVPGADSRCLQEGVSSLSAFLRVAKTGDPMNDFWLDLNVGATPFGVEPIDSLQILYEAFVEQDTMQVGLSEIHQNRTNIYPNPATNRLNVTSRENIDRIQVMDHLGRQVTAIEVMMEKHLRINLDAFEGGCYMIRIEYTDGLSSSHSFIVKKTL